MRLRTQRATGKLSWWFTITDMKSIDLGREGGGPCCPCEAPSSTGEKRVEYPTLYLILDEGQALKDFPSEGTLTVKYEVKLDNRNVKRGTRNLEIDVKEILDVTPEDKHTPTAEERFEEVAAEVRGDEDDDDDEGE